MTPTERKAEQQRQAKRSRTNENRRVSNRRFVNVHFMADRYESSVPTIWRWARDGLIPPPIKIGPNSTRWDLEEVEARDAERESVS